MMRCILLIAAAICLSACQDKKPSRQQVNAGVAVSKAYAAKAPAVIHTETLQLIHFEGNFDYWSCVFLNSKKDTVALVTDTAITDKFKNRLFEVKWFVDTLFEAGDNDSKYAAKRMSKFKLLTGKPFAEPLTEDKILKDVRNIPEIQSGAEEVRIAERPSGDKNYYVIETGNRETDRFARFLMLRVYTYPQYEVRVYDPEKDADVSFEKWRKRVEEQ